MGVLLKANELLAALAEHPEAVAVPAVLNGSAAYVVPGPGGQGTGVVGLDILFHHGAQLPGLQFDAVCVLFLPVAGGYRACQTP